MSVTELTQPFIKMKGIAFKPEMVSAIQAGIKTQTRRKQLTYNPPVSAGEVLYIKERHRVISFDESTAVVEYAGDDRPYLCCISCDDFKALKKRKKPNAWLSAMYMRQHFHRLQIRVKEVRSEQLWSISDADALAEGVKRLEDGRYPDYATKGESWGTPACSFISLYASIHKMKTWDVPEGTRVWVITFEKV